MQKAPFREKALLLLMILCLAHHFPGSATHQGTVRQGISTSTISRGLIPSAHTMPDFLLSPISSLDLTP
uniref:Uncharacterized protein n=1 Tax=Cannabis sativa TaxID=3483 RepID=A0A803QW82_CANSA